MSIVLGAFALRPSMPRNGAPSLSSPSIGCGDGAPYTLLCSCGPDANIAARAAAAKPLRPTPAMPASPPDCVSMSSSNRGFWIFWMNGRPAGLTDAGVDGRVSPPWGARLETDGRRSPAGFWMNGRTGVIVAGVLGRLSPGAILETEGLRSPGFVMNGRAAGVEGREPAGEVMNGVLAGPMDEGVDGRESGSEMFDAEVLRSIDGAVEDRSRERASKGRANAGAGGVGPCACAGARGAPPSYGLGERVRMLRPSGVPARNGGDSERRVMDDEVEFRALSEL
jgi:hypothetical protein